MREVAALLLVGLLAYGGYSCYQYGYDTRDAEALRKESELQTKLTHAEAANHEHAVKLEQDLAAARRQSDKLAAQIRSARFDCERIGGNFVELYNAGTRAGAGL